MIHRIYSVRDSKADAFGQPFFFKQDGEAIRSVETEVNRIDERNALNKYCEDFSLWFMGTFDDQDGIFKATTPKLIINCDQLKKGMLQSGIAAV